jgi:hypothetical protein
MLNNALVDTIGDLGSIVNKTIVYPRVGTQLMKSGNPKISYIERGRASMFVVFSLCKQMGKKRRNKCKKSMKLGKGPFFLSIFFLHHHHT